MPALLLTGLGAGVYLVPHSDDYVRRALVQQNVAAYLSSGQTCPCPYSLDRNGRKCVGQTKFARTGGARPICYPDEVSDAMVQTWRAIHQ